MPNAFAYLVLFSWPLAAYLLFRLLNPGAALAWTIIGGYLILPTQTNFNLPMLPTLDKDSVPALSAGLMALLGVGAGLPGRAPQTLPVYTSARGLMILLVILLGVSPVLTVLNNSEPVVFGPAFLPGLKPYDMGSVALFLGITVLPFLLARRHLASPERHTTLLKIIAVSMLLYSVLILYEIRMSPQLNQMIYGFFPHSFLQHIRAGGFRPLVFLPHGLWLAILVSMATLAAAALWRQRFIEGVRNGQWLLGCIYLLVVLLLSNSFGALAIAVVGLPALFFLGIRGQLILAGSVACTVLLYPLLREAELVPVEQGYELALSIDVERAESFRFRVQNEDALLERAAEKPLSGWGQWGRGFLYDVESGHQTTIPDGAWIITIGAFGWLGYIAQFGLLTLPVLLLAIRRRKLDLTPATGGLALVMAANLGDLVPNATLTPVTWLVAGALAGRLAYVAAPSEAAAADTPARPARRWSVVGEKDGPALAPGHPARVTLARKRA